MLYFQVELLLEIEESLPQWILKRVQVDKHEEFPNRGSKLQTKVSMPKLICRDLGWGLKSRQEAGYYQI